MDKTILISTIQRSGTWHLKYFFRFLADFQAGRVPDLERIYDDANDPVATTFLAPFGVAAIRIDHFPFPMPADIPDGLHPGLALLKQISAELGRARFERDAYVLTESLQPRAAGQRCALVHRNIFEQYASTVVGLLPRVATGPSAGQWPIDLSKAEAPTLAAHFAAMPQSRVADAYAHRVLGFKIGRFLYPGRVAILRYEHVITGGVDPKRDLLRFLGIEADERALLSACDAVTKARMQVYEQTLGRPLSGRVTTRESHLSPGNTTGLYRQYVTPAVARAVKQRLAALGVAEMVWRTEDDDLL